MRNANKPGVGRPDPAGMVRRKSKTEEELVETETFKQAHDLSHWARGTQLAEAAASAFKT